jgi:hypothetical protein
MELSSRASRIYQGWGGTNMPGKMIPLVLLVAALGSTGCRVQEHGSHDNKDVKIETPLGDIKVKTNNAVVATEIGIPVYPGVTAVKKDKDNGAADIDISFGDFHLMVKAAGYLTSDSPEKVRAFYRKELARFRTSADGQLARGFEPAPSSIGGTARPEPRIRIPIHNGSRNGADEEHWAKTGSGDPAGAAEGEEQVPIRSGAAGHIILQTLDVAETVAELLEYFYSHFQIRDGTILAAPPRTQSTMT